MPSDHPTEQLQDPAQDQGQDQAQDRAETEIEPVKVQPTFVHLRVHSEFSLVDGVVKIKALANKISENAMPAVALTDQSNMFAAVRFFKTALDKGIKPLLVRK